MNSLCVGLCTNISRRATLMGDWYCSLLSRRCTATTWSPTTKRFFLIFRQYNHHNPRIRFNLDYIVVTNIVTEDFYNLWLGSTTPWNFTTYGFGFSNFHPGLKPLCWLAEYLWSKDTPIPFNKVQHGWIVLFWEQLSLEAESSIGLVLQDKPYNLPQVPWGLVFLLPVEVFTSLHK